MPRAMKRCNGLTNWPCVELIAAGARRCERCEAEAERRRGTAQQRGYGSRHETRFRAGVLKKDPVCRIPTGCRRPSTDADHYPLDRDELVRLGMDPDDPQHGRGLCARHHSQETAKRQPGGWARRGANR